jgi:hypothetical protein
MPVDLAVLAGAAAGCAKAVIGRTARVEATSRLEIRVMVFFLSTGGLPGCD